MKRFFESNKLIGRMERAVPVRAVRGGLTLMIPVLVVGAISLILKTFPVDAYQNFIASFADGLLLKLFDIIFSATFGALSVYSTVCISSEFMRIKADPDTGRGGAMLASLVSFFILSGAYNSSFGTDSMGPKSMFLAILTGLGASYVYLAFWRLFRKRRHGSLLTTGSDGRFNRMLTTLFPIAITAVIFAVFNLLVMLLFKVDSFRELLANAFNGIFAFEGTGFVKGFLFVLLSSVLWFFGIHGSDTLEGVMQTYFAPGLTANQLAAAAGQAPSTVLTKEFFDCFVLIGGCGAALCLLIAILLFSKNVSRKRLGWTAALPMLFNINELMVFGIPIVFEPILLIPFLAVPLICYSISYAAVSLGLVPMITESVEWTTPILLGGYRATGSIAGSLLQLFNLCLGVLVYLPFVRMLDRQSELNARRDFEGFMQFFRENEPEFALKRVTDRGDKYGDLAKGLCAEIRHGIRKGIELYYQPQYHYYGQCEGVEALLRWKHPVHGMLYPPLVVKLAEEGGFLPELEEAVLLKALEDRPKIYKKFGKNIKLSVNVTGTTIVTERYIDFIRKLNEKEPFEGKNICIELTEQAAISFNEDTLSKLRELHSMGILLAIDDFSMGQTSMHYLSDGLFDILKLDGSLVDGIFTHANTKEIVASIVKLANSLGMVVLAEYVEKGEQRVALHEIGCERYQGYLYSPAVKVE